MPSQLCSAAHRDFSSLVLRYLPSLLPRLPPTNLHLGVTGIVYFEIIGKHFIFSKSFGKKKVNITLLCITFNFPIYSYRYQCSQELGWAHQLKEEPSQTPSPPSLLPPLSPSDSEPETFLEGSTHLCFIRDLRIRDLALNAFLNRNRQVNHSLVKIPGRETWILGLPDG